MTTPFGPKGLLNDEVNVEQVSTRRSINTWHRHAVALFVCDV